VTFSIIDVEPFPGNFPLMMDSIMAPVLVDDVNGDGEMELVVTDSNSNVACYNSKGQEIWDSRISGRSNEVQKRERERAGRE
jgi:hypothetical protein